MFPLFESIRVIEGKPLHLRDHQDRINRSCLEYYAQLPTWNIIGALEVLPADDAILKCRLEYNLSEYHFKCTRYQKKKITRLFLREGHELNYDLKWTDRSGINKLMDGLTFHEDILIVRDGLFTDSSYSNLAFSNGETWHTPRIPLLAGTCRSRLLENETLVEADISLSDVGRYKSIRLFNAMIPWHESIELPMSTVITA